MPDRKTPRELLAAAGKLDPDVIAVRYRGRTVDLHTPVEATAPELTPIRATDKEGLAVIRHSTAHVMADAVQRLFPGTKVTIGPAIEDGFLLRLRQAGRRLHRRRSAPDRGHDGRHHQQDSPFRRVVVTRDEARRMFSTMGETYKLEIIDAIPPRRGSQPLQARRAAQRVGRRVRGAARARRPGSLQAVKLTHVAGAYWRGDERNPMLQRIYGTAFSFVGSARGAPEAARAGQAARSPQARQRARARHVRRVAPAMPFFLPKGRSSTTGWSSTSAISTSARVRGGHHAAGVRSPALSHERPPRQLQREHVPAGPRTAPGGPPRSDGAVRASVSIRASRGSSLKEGLQNRAFRAQADELPQPLRHLQCAPAQLPRASVARGGLRPPPPLRARRRRSRPGARSQFARTTAHLLRRGAGRRRDREVHRPSSTASTRRSVRDDRRQARDAAAPTSASAPTRSGTWRSERRSGRASSARG
jgi:hypothetical protein